MAAKDLIHNSKLTVGLIAERNEPLSIPEYKFYLQFKRTHNFHKKYLKPDNDKKSVD